MNHFTPIACEVSPATTLKVQRIFSDFAMFLFWLSWSWESDYCKGLASQDVLNAEGAHHIMMGR